MPRPILTGPVSRASVSGPPTSHAPITGGLAGAKLQLRLRQTRTKTYVDALIRLDASTHHQDRVALDQTIAEIAAEFPELTIEQRPIGILSRCYLGAPYEVHICDLAGSIVEHFETFRPLPPAYERARELAKHARYAFVEIYADCVCAVSADGSVAVIEI